MCILELLNKYSVEIAIALISTTISGSVGFFWRNITARLKYFFNHKPWFLKGTYHLYFVSLFDRKTIVPCKLIVGGIIDKKRRKAVFKNEERNLSYDAVIRVVGEFVYVEVEEQLELSLGNYVFYKPIKNEGFESIGVVSGPGIGRELAAGPAMISSKPVEIPKVKRLLDGFGEVDIARKEFISAHHNRSE